MRKAPSSEIALPENLTDTLIKRFRIKQHIRSFFEGRGYVEVSTPVRVKCPCMDPYIDAVPAGDGLYLATSPEIHMKRLLRPGLDRLYQMTHAFRAGERGRLHSPEFEMLEWYRSGTDYLGVMQETEDLVGYISSRMKLNSAKADMPVKRLTVSELYRQTAGWDPSAHWDEERYFMDWAEKIEPSLKTRGPLFLMDFPAPLAALSKISDRNPNVCERFELFIEGVEIANAFSELTDADEHVRRFESDARKRNSMGKQPYPADEGLIRAARLGLPECGGVAVGVDRLVMVLLGADNIEQVQAFPMSRL